MKNCSSKLKIFTFYIVILIFTFYIFNFVNAAIVPCGPGTAKAECDFCDFYKLLKNAVDFILRLSSVVAGAIVLWGGVLILTAQGNPGKISAGKGVIWQAIIGLAIMFTGWLVINLIITTLANGDLQNWYQFKPNC